MLRYAVRINGINALAVTKLDVLTGLESLQLCTAYRRAGQTCTDLPFGPSDLSPYEPVYEQFAGWKEQVGMVRRWNELPSAARAYLDRIASLAGVPIRLVSVGPEREQVVEMI